MYEKTVVCLANSRRPYGACIAGRESAHDDFGPWIRPVGDRPKHEVRDEECKLADGSKLRLLDVVSIPLQRPAPEGHQQENHVIDAGYSWTRVGRLGYAGLTAAVESPAQLWVNGHKTSNGLNDKVPASRAETLRSSLCLVRPENLALRVSIEGEAFGQPKRRVRAWFRLSGHDYGLTVTDPVVEEALRAREDGYMHSVPHAYLCVSLTMAYEHDNCCHKLVAAVITPDREGE